jgi:hypothetical protein
LYMVVIFALVLIVMPMITGNESSRLSWNDLQSNSQLQILMVFFLGYSLIYPLIGFTKIRHHLNGSFEQNRDVFEKAFETLNFIKTIDSPDKIVYRRKSKLARFLQWYEDDVVIIPNENPVILSGLRKSVTRIDRIIDHLLIKGSE